MFELCFCITGSSKGGKNREKYTVTVKGQKLALFDLQSHVNGFWVFSVFESSSNTGSYDQVLQKILVNIGFPLIDVIIIYVSTK